MSHTAAGPRKAPHKPPLVPWCRSDPGGRLSVLWAVCTMKTGLFTFCVFCVLRDMGRSANYERGISAMTRVKEEFRKRGIELENDYEFLPCNGVETVQVDAEKAIVSIYHVSAGWTYLEMRRNGYIAIYSE